MIMGEAWARKKTKGVQLCIIIQPRTIKRPTKHLYTYDTDTEDLLSDDESAAKESDTGDEQLELPCFEQADIQMPL